MTKRGLTLIVCLLLFITITVDVKANWTNVPACPEGTTELTSFLESDMEGVNNMTSSKDYCVVDSISPSQVAYIESSQIYVCINKEHKKAIDKHCCPDNATKVVTGALTSKCVSSNGDSVGYTYNPTGYTLGKSQFPKKEDHVKCEGPNCYIKNGKLASPEVLSKSESQKYKCIAPGDTYDIDGETLTCGGGKLLTDEENKKAQEENKQLEETQEAFADLPNLLGACDAYREDGDTDEYNKCVKCYEKCRGQEACPLVYNALGCIDTNPNGLITRTLQIGIGLMGGLGLVRLIQAAILRQTNDPSKIKEASEMFTSVLIGGVLLIFGIIILRFIGINVLQIMPDDFLSFGE